MHLLMGCAPIISYCTRKGAQHLSEADHCVVGTFISNKEGYTVSDIAELFGDLHFIFESISTIA